MKKVQLEEKKAREDQVVEKSDDKEEEVKVEGN